MAVRRKKDDQPMPEVHSDWQAKQVLKARNPEWLRARAAACRAIINGTYYRHDHEHASAYLRLRPHSWLEREAATCEERATAIENGEQVSDWYITAKGSR